MSAQAQIERRDWAGLLLAAIIWLVLWDSFLFFALNYTVVFTPNVFLALLLLAPFAGLLLMTYLFVWRKRKSLATIGCGILGAVVLVICVGTLVGRIHAMIYSVPVMVLD